jgi:hypothetical protein
MHARYIAAAALLLSSLAATPVYCADEQIRLEAPTMQVEITPATLKQVERVDEYDKPGDAMPSRVVTITKEAQLTPERFDELVRDIEQTGFFSLAEQYGAGEGPRVYPYTISVRYKGKDKTVTYRSGGDSQRPVAFTETYDDIIRFANSLTKVK